MLRSRDYSALVLGNAETVGNVHRRVARIFIRRGHDDEGPKIPSEVRSAKGGGVWGGAP